MEGFSIKTDYYTEDNSIVVVRLSGYVDQSNSHQIEKIISDLLQTNRQKLVFDLRELIYMSSAGWGIFVGEIKTVRDAGGDIKVAAMSPEVYDVFQVLEFYHILEDFATVDDAIDGFIKNGGGETHDIFDDVSGTEEDTEIENLLDFSGIQPAQKVEERKVQEKISQKEAKRVEKKIEKKIPEQKKPREETRIAGTVLKPAPEVKIDIAKLPLNEKLKKIVSVYPLLNLSQMRKMLRHEKFGFIKISLYKLHKQLKELNLHNKKLRYRYYRST